VNDADSEPFVMLGGYGGQVFKLGSTTNDGIVSGTITGTFTAGSSSITSITDTGASFVTSGAGLVERKVTILNSDDLPVTTGVRPRITANTGTVLTLNEAVSNLISGDTYTYVVGGPDWVFDTAWLDLNDPFAKKRVEFLQIMALLDGGTLYVDRHRNQRDRTLQLTRFATVTSDAVGWDEAEWADDDGVAEEGELIWDNTEVTFRRLRVGATGIQFAWRFRNPFANQPMTLLKTQLLGLLIGNKLG
jgi:hypothetical protein